MKQKVFSGKVFVSVEQFQALARLAGMRSNSAACMGAMDHIVNKVKQREAAEKLNVTPVTISKAIERLRRAELDAILVTR